MAQKLAYCDLGFAKVDTGRLRRRGFCEVIYCPGKTKEHLKKISRTIIKENQDLLLTRLEKSTFIYLKKSFPKLKYNPLARLGYIIKIAKVSAKGLVFHPCTPSELKRLSKGEESCTHGSRSKRQVELSLPALPDARDRHGYALRPG